MRHRLWQAVLTDRQMLQKIDTINNRIYNIWDSSKDFYRRSITMKKILGLVLTLALVLSAAAATADLTAINGTDERNITINKAGLNPPAEEMIALGISPTTGRKLDQVSYEEGFTGTAITKKYQPVMVQISNHKGGVETNSRGEPSTAPINMQYADVVYEALQARNAEGGTLTRFSAVFSDVIPYYAGPVRSARLTHIHLRQEWNCAFCTSGYATGYIPDELEALGVKKPNNATEEDPGLLYVYDLPRAAWKDYLKRTGKEANTEVFELANIMRNVYPKYEEMDPSSEEYAQNAPYNHTFKFADEAPETDDSAEHIEVTFSGGIQAVSDKIQTDSILEYDDSTNSYLRYVTNGKDRPIPYRVQKLINPTNNKMDSTMLDVEGREYGEQISFTNVIIQSITMKWRGYEQPDPDLTGTGNADYFMGGKHYSGVWERTDINSRTVFYDEDGNEISLLPGKTLIILMDYSIYGCSVAYE